MSTSAARPRDDEIRRFLQDVLDERVTGLQRRPHAYRTSHALEELVVQLAGGRRLALVFKDLGRQRLAPIARLAKPDFVYEPLREIEVYRDVLAGRALGTAKYYGSLVDPAAARYWLAIENVPGTVLWQIGDLRTWQCAARRLAEMHERLVGVRAVTLRKLDAAHFAVWLPRAAGVVPKSDVGRIAACYEGVARYVEQLPTTLVHGELYASNVLVHTTVDGVRMCPVDWEMAGVGSGLLDLAALTAGWGDEQRSAIASAYSEGLKNPLHEHDLMRGLDCCRLLLAVQWLGWSAAWSPPAEHAHDWLSEALEAVERLAR